jgi:2-polyprenyl-6-methoxyphenol hydroxylase-like FAD-dependent oxidoreductase
MLLQNKKIAIVGAGPGGLTLAKLLQLKGADVKLYERDFDKHARVQGSPLDLHDESGLAAIRKANLSEEFKQNFLPRADRKLITNDLAEVLLSDHDTKLEENFGSEHFRPEIDRGTLRKILLESLQPGTVLWDSHFISMDAKNGGWLLHFKNGSSVYADMVIAADGANSKIRPYITGIKAFYSGITMLEGNIYGAEKAAPRMNHFLNGGKIMAFGNSKDLFVGQKGGGDIGFGASFKTDENWTANSGLDYTNKKQVLDWFTTEYSGWSPVWYELFESATTPFIARPIYCAPLDQTWEPLSNLTMIGDAAHVMPPFAGEGANVAMWDAMELSEYLTDRKYNSLKEAISNFEIAMRKRAAMAAGESLKNGERMHSEGALEMMLDFFKGHS